jgi:tetratricopeptide (TPR) repeat protein
MYFWEQVNPEGFEKSLEYFNKAMEIDPTWAHPYAAIAAWWMGVKQFGVFPASVANPHIFENINKALEIDPESDFVNYVNAGMVVWTNWDWEAGEREFLKVLDINPNYALGRIYYGHLLMCLRRTDEAFEQGQIALALDPLNPLIQGVYSMILLDRGAHKEIIESFGKVHHPLTLFALERSYHALGDYEKSFEALEDSTIFAIQQAYEEGGYKAGLESVVSAYEQKSEVSFVMPTDMAWIYREEIGKPEKTLEWLEIGFEMNDPAMPYLATGVFPFDFIHEDPRYIDLLKKMKLPLE